MLKVIFLDIDGVVNDADWIVSQRDNCLLKGEQWTTDDAIDPNRIEILNRILVSTGAKVVISSTWRCSSTPAQLQKHLSHFGFQGEIIGFTDDNNKSRFTQISDWIDNNSLIVDDFIILDDIAVIPDSLPKLQRFQHIVDDTVGLTNTDADAIIARLVPIV